MVCRPLAGQQIHQASVGSLVRGAQVVAHADGGVGGDGVTQASLGSDPLHKGDFPAAGGTGGGKVEGPAGEGPAVWPALGRDVAAATLARVDLADADDARDPIQAQACGVAGCGDGSDLLSVGLRPGAAGGAAVAREGANADAVDLDVVDGVALVRGPDDDKVLVGVWLGAATGAHFVGGEHGHHGATHLAAAIDGAARGVGAEHRDVAVLQARVVVGAGLGAGFGGLGSGGDCGVGCERHHGDSARIADDEGRRRAADVGGEECGGGDGVGMGCARGQQADQQQQEQRAGDHWPTLQAHKAPCMGSRWTAPASSRTAATSPQHRPSAWASGSDSDRGSRTTSPSCA